MQIVSWNVNGLRACAEKGFLDFVGSADPDILCLQETKAHPDQLDEELRHPGGRLSYWSSARRPGYSGVVTYTKKEVKQASSQIGIKKFDREGRIVCTRHEDFLLYNVYFPNGSANEQRHYFKQEFLERFRRHLRRQLEAGEEIIVVGDYNTAHTDMDVFDPVQLEQASGFLPEERQWFERFLETGFIDTFRYFHPDEQHRFTYWSYQKKARMGNRGWRIDYICVSKGLESRLKGAEILDEQQGSDHCPVLLELAEG